jgi:hypothetical protein
MPKTSPLSGFHASISQFGVIKIQREQVVEEKKEHCIHYSTQERERDRNERENLYVLL